MKLYHTDVKRYNRGMNKAVSFVNKAKKYRDMNGYRENLGYDSEPKLTDFLSKLSLSYQEERAILDEFHRMCDGI